MFKWPVVAGRRGRPDSATEERAVSSGTARDVSGSGRASYQGRFIGLVGVVARGNLAVARFLPYGTMARGCRLTRWPCERRCYSPLPSEGNRWEAMPVEVCVAKLAGRGLSTRKIAAPLESEGYSPMSRMRVARILRREAQLRPD